MTRIYDCTSDSDTNGSTYAAHLEMARTAIDRGALVVIPTDTVYGVAADAFNAEAVQRLLDAKGRSRQSPPPVLIPSISTLDALAVDVPQPVRDLVDAFWPGGLTVIVNAQPSLVWDLGETRGTVALRMPSNQIALDLLAETGPLAVSSANLSGMPATCDAQSAEAAFGEKIDVYLDGGTAGVTYDSVFGQPSEEGPVEDQPPEGSSTIVDASGFETNGGFVYIVRSGVISRDAIAAVVGDVLAAAPSQPAISTEMADAPETATIAAPSQNETQNETKDETDASR